MISKKKKVNYQESHFNRISYVMILLLFLFLVNGCTSPVITETDISKAPSFEGFELSEEPIDDDQILLYSNDQDTLRVKIISDLNQESARELIHITVLTMQSLYDTTSAAYPGRISKEIICDSKFIPKRRDSEYNGMNITYFVAYLSNRLTYGACTDDLTPYKGILAWSYCENKKELRQFEFISRKDSFSESSIDFVKENICN